jgi:hypothetical protein
MNIHSTVRVARMGSWQVIRFEQCVAENLVLYVKLFQAVLMPA